MGFRLELVRLSSDSWSEDLSRSQLQVEREVVYWNSGCYTKKISLLGIPFMDINNIISNPDCLYVEGASGVLPLSIAKVTLDDQKSKAVDFTIMWSASSISSSCAPYISLPELIEFLTEVLGQSAYAYMNLSIQYWTSRGWAFVDVNYGGSTGYGGEYRDKLLGR